MMGAWVVMWSLELGLGWNTLDEMRDISVGCDVSFSCVLRVANAEGDMLVKGVFGLIIFYLAHKFVP